MSDLKAISLVWKPTSNGAYKKLQGAGEISALKLAAGGGSAHVSIYDSATQEGCSENSLRWVLDASTTDVDSQIFNEALTFQKGVSAILDQGGGFNPELCIAASRYVV